MTATAATKAAVIVPVDEADMPIVFPYSRTPLSFWGVVFAILVANTITAAIALFVVWGMQPRF